MGKESKRVLIITYDMIPSASSWGGCQRMYYLSEYLVAKGWDVTVFSCKKNNMNNYGNEIHFDSKPMPIKNRWLRAYINSKSVTRTNINVVKKQQCSYSIMAWLRRKVKGNARILNLFNNIDAYFNNEPTFLSGVISKEWVKEYEQLIMDFIIANRINNVIISVPAFHILSIGERLKKRCGEKINLIYDYRDPWNMWKKTSITCFLTEKKYLKVADKIVCTNEYLAHDMSETFNIAKEHFYVIANGYSEMKWSNVRDDTESLSEKKFVLSYVGSIEIVYDGIRNIEYVIRAFRKLSKAHEDVELHFVGVNDLTLPSVQRLQKEFKNITFQGVIPAVQSLEYMRKSSALLLLHTTDDNSSQYIVSGKLYDYAKAGRPVLSVGSENGIHKKLIEDYGIGIAVRNNETEIYSAMEKMYKMWKNGVLCVPKRDISSFSRENQNRKYETLLEKGTI